MSQAAGWYPNNTGQMQYWDGAAWGQMQAMSTQEPGTPPPAPAGSPLPPPPPPGGYAPAPYAGAPAYGYGGPGLPAVLQGRELSGWWIRVAAELIDGLFAITIIGFIVNFFLMGREGERNGQTLGKQLCNIRVIKEDGTPVTAGFAVLRDFVVKGLLFGTVGSFFLGIPTLLNVLWPLWDERNQALHDKMLSAYVVKG
jgi:uncharacterized RDD family membrane protein YckC